MSRNLSVILNLIGWLIALAIGFFPIWESIPSWTKYVILGFIGALVSVTLVIGIIPASRLIRNWVGLLKIQRQQRRSLFKLVELVGEAGFLFDPHATCSLRYYVDSVCNAIVRDLSLHSNVRRLAERLHILGDWHWSLLAFENTAFGHKTPFARIIQDVIRFYRDTADVARELASIELPEDGSLRAYEDSERMAKEKYNEHIGRLEQLLMQIAKTNPELHTGAFHRF